MSEQEPWAWAVTVPPEHSCGYDYLVYANKEEADRDSQAFFEDYDFDSAVVPLFPGQLEPRVREVPDA